MGIINIKAQENISKKKSFDFNSSIIDILPENENIFILSHPTDKGISFDSLNTNSGVLQTIFKFDNYNSGTIYFDKAQNRIYLLLSSIDTLSLFEYNLEANSLLKIFTHDFRTIKNIRKLKSVDSKSFYFLAETDSFGILGSINTQKIEIIIHKTNSNSIDVYRNFEIIGSKLFANTRAKIDSNNLVKLGLFIDIFNLELSLDKTITILEDTNNNGTKIIINQTGDLIKHSNKIYLQTIVKNTLDHQYFYTFCYDSNGILITSKYNLIDSNFFGYSYNYTSFFYSSNLFSIIRMDSINSTTTSLQFVQTDENLNEFYFSKYFISNIKRPFLYSAYLDNSTIWINVLDLDSTIFHSLQSFSLNFPLFIESQKMNSKGYFSIFPNPATNEFTFSASERTESIDILDVFGKKIKSINTPNHPALISIEDLNVGVYFLVFKLLNGNSSIQKIIKR